MDPLHHKQETLILTSPVTGRAADLDQTPDTYFASGLMGAGAVLFPREGRLLAPCDAVVNVEDDPQAHVGQVSAIP